MRTQRGQAGVAAAGHVQAASMQGGEPIPPDDGRQRGFDRRARSRHQLGNLRGVGTDITTVRQGCCKVTNIRPVFHANGLLRCCERRLLRTARQPSNANFERAAVHCCRPQQLAKQPPPRLCGRKQTSAARAPRPRPGPVAKAKAVPLPLLAPRACEPVQCWPTMDAVAINSANNDIDTAPDTAYGSSVGFSLYFSSSAGFSRETFTWPIDQPAKRRSPISS